MKESQFLINSSPRFLKTFKLLLFQFVITQHHEHLWQSNGAYQRNLDEIKHKVLVISINSTLLYRVLPEDYIDCSSTR